MSSRTSKRSKRKVNSYEGATSTEEARMFQQAIANSKLDMARGSNLIEEIGNGPVFFPTVEEFSHPLDYINKIRREAAQWGICKIVPPSGWNMPCEVDMNSTKEFETKKQSVNRLQEGLTFDEGEDYNPSAYQAYASESARAWKEKHYADRDMTPEALEKDYWDIVETNKADFDAEYGNDIDCTEYWSGFPLSRRGRAINGTEEEKGKEGEPEFGTDEYYRESWWNLNNMPSCPGSVLRHVKVPINGVNVPWLYMGTLFSTFCWHNEDNYLYSINYHHKGAPKQWYGVPGTRKDADGLEKVFKNFLIGRMKDAPDLLHHITTMFSPILLRKADIPVCKILQHPGEFIVTFPRAFHGGFSMGPNIGEAVNFATPDWISHGADASERYRNFSRQAVFSHDRLMFTMAQYLNEHSIASCEMLISELTRVIREEETLRTKLLESGIQDVSGKVPLPRNKLDQLDEESANYDDKRTCLICKHICFFSAVACRCSTSNVSCLRHSNWLCSCPPRQKFLLTWTSTKEMLEVQSKVQNHLNILRAKSKSDSATYPPPPPSPNHGVKRQPSAGGYSIAGPSLSPELLKNQERDRENHGNFCCPVTPAVPLPVMYNKIAAEHTEGQGTVEGLGGGEVKIEPENDASTSSASVALPLEVGSSAPVVAGGVIKTENGAMEQPIAATDSDDSGSGNETTKVLDVGNAKVEERGEGGGDVY